VAATVRGLGRIGPSGCAETSRRGSLSSLAVSGFLLPPLFLLAVARALSRQPSYIRPSAPPNLLSDILASLLGV
jgi:hypothetical protein